MFIIFAKNKTKMKKVVLILALTMGLGLSSVSVAGMPAAQGDIASSLAAAQPSARGVHSAIELGNPLETAVVFQIYSITGQLVKTVDVSAGSVLTVDLPTGCYIVKCSKWSKKIIVR